MSLLDTVNEVIGDLAVPCALIYSASRNVGGILADVARDPFG